MSVPRDELKELRTTFLDEFREALEQYQIYLRQLEDSPRNATVLAAFFREVHSLKGAAAFIGLQNLNSLLHNLEHVLSRVRNRKLKFNTSVLELFDNGFDLLRQLQNTIETTGNDDVDINPFLTTLNRRLKKDPAAPPSVDSGKTVKPPTGSADEISEVLNMFFADAEEFLQNIELEIEKLKQTSGKEWTTRPLRKIFHSLAGAGQFVGFPEFNELCTDLEKFIGRMDTEKSDARAEALTVLAESRRELAQLLQKRRGGKPPGKKWRKLREKIHSKLVEPEETSPIGTAAPADFSDRTIRVPVERLDHLMNVVGELVLTRNRMLQLFKHSQKKIAPDENIRDTYDTLDFLIREIQASVLQTRMVPIARVFNQFPHFVRDIAKKFHKKIKLEIEGEKTDVDKSVIEMLGDPLIHLLRNAVDHGIESPAERKKLGKPATGKIVLSAQHQGNQIVVQCYDDGRGIDPDAIRRAAVKKGLIGQEKAFSLSEKDVLNLIFLPGFSTVENVNMLSGRGVGMDVVKSNITRLNGFIEMESQIGKGTCFRLHFPLTMAIIQGLLIEAGTEIFIVPIHSVLETVRTVEFPVQPVWGHPAIRLRNQVIPVVYLDELFQFRSSPETRRAKYLVLVGLGEKKIGIAADRLLGEREVVIKKMGRFLEDTPGFSGATILGDGSVRLIIDVGGLMKLARFENLNVAEAS